jgi:hypothetical protein
MRPRARKVANRVRLSPRGERAGYRIAHAIRQTLSDPSPVVVWSASRRLSSYLSMCGYVASNDRGRSDAGTVVYLRSLPSLRRDARAVRGRLERGGVLVIPYGANADAFDAFITSQGFEYIATQSDHIFYAKVNQ